MKKKHIIRNRYIFLVDILLILLSYSCATIFMFNIEYFSVVMLGGVAQVFLSCLFFLFFLSLFGIYQTDWLNASPTDNIRLFVSLSVGAVFSILSGMFFGTKTFFLKYNICASAITLLLICMFRFSLRVFFKSFSYRSSHKGKRVLIIGAGSLAVTLLREIYELDSQNYNVVGLIDDDKSKINQRVYGIKVVGTSNDIDTVCQKMSVEEILFAIHDISPAEKTRILNICSETGVKVRHITGIVASMIGSASLKNAKTIQIEDLLDRSVVSLDNQLIEADIAGKTVLVTGGGGSIGSELCRQIISFSPAKLIIFDVYENTTFELQNELNAMSHIKPIVLIGSVRDKERLNYVFDKYHPDIVFHAAAHKHVPLMEDSPGEAIKNNIFGTYNTAMCALEYGCKRFVLISTDKAVNPTNVMGASKRMCEMIVQSLQEKSKTEFVAVRFGNVLGSNGSVIPFFKKQIEAGGPVTVTHPEITRFFMTIPEAAQLVLQAASYAKGGEIFVLDMGAPVKIYDLAKKMIRLSGYEVEKDIKIEFVGLRPGEKLYEELMMSEEGLTETAHNKIFIGKQSEVDSEKLKEYLEKLYNVANSDTEKIKEILSDAVPTYQYKK